MLLAELLVRAHNARLAVIEVSPTTPKDLAHAVGTVRIAILRHAPIVLLLRRGVGSGGRLTLGVLVVCLRVGVVLPVRI